MESTKKLNRWSNDEVQALLSIYAEEEIQRDFQSATRNDRVYAKIAARLSDVNINRTAKKVGEKLKKLKQDYKKIKDHNNRSGSDRWTSKWYDRLDAILGQGPAFSVSVATKDSATVPLEAKRDEPTETGEQMEDAFSDETVLGGNMDAEAGPLLFTPAATSSPRRSVGHTRRGKRKRERDDLFIDALWEIEDSNRAAMQHVYKQRDRYMQHLLEAQVQENELRRRELEVMRAEAEESRRLQRELQDGLLAVLRRLVHRLSPGAG